VIRALTGGTALAVGAGLAIGWWASLLLGRLMSSDLAGITGDDVPTRVVAAVLLFACCALAAYRPASAVLSVSPADALRE
jgi:hypothetical protein